MNGDVGTAFNHLTFDLGREQPLAADLCERPCIAVAGRGDGLDLDIDVRVRGSEAGRYPFCLQERELRPARGDEYLVREWAHRRARRALGGPPHIHGPASKPTDLGP